MIYMHVPSQCCFYLTMEAIIFVIASYLVLLHGGQIQGFQILQPVPNAANLLPNANNYAVNTPLGFSVPYPRVLTPFMKYGPLSKNPDQTYYSQPYDFENERFYAAKDKGIANYKNFDYYIDEEDNTNVPPGLNLMSILYQKLTHPKIFTKTNLRNIDINNPRFWHYVSDVFTQSYFYKNPEDVAVFQRSNLRQQYTKFKTILPVFMRYVMNRWGYDIKRRTSLRRVYEDLEKHKDIDFNTFKNVVAKKERSFIPYQAISLPSSQEATDATIINDVDATGDDPSNNRLNNKLRVANRPINHKLLNIFKGKEIKVNVGHPDLWEEHNKDINNLPENPVSDKQVTTVSDNRLLKPNCGLGDISVSLRSLIKNPNIAKEKDNLEKLFKILQRYGLRLGKNNPSFGTIINNLENLLLGPNDKPSPEAQRRDFTYAWQIFTLDYSYGELGKLLADIRAGRDKDVKAITEKLTSKFLKLKERLKQAGISDEVINYVLKEGLKPCVSSISSVLVEECKKKSLSDVLQTLENALNVPPATPNLKQFSDLAKIPT